MLEKLASTEPGRGDREQIRSLEKQAEQVGMPQRSPVVVTGSRTIISASTRSSWTWPQRSPVVVTGSSPAVLAASGTVPACLNGARSW